jgi:hypothetical protein
VRSWWIYVHPITMTALIALGLGVLREGLTLRNRRLRGRSGESQRHAWLGKIFVPLLALGYVEGVISMYLLRDEPLLESVHWVLATAVVLTGTGAGCLGLALEQGRAQERRAAHGLIGAACVLLALGSAVAGMALLP